MSMTVMLTRNVPDRTRGFLASTMLELAPGVYSAPKLSPAVRDRIWQVILDWHDPTTLNYVCMLWTDKTIAGGQGFSSVGSPPVEIVEVDGLLLSRRLG